MIEIEQTELRNQKGALQPASYKNCLFENCHFSLLDCAGCSFFECRFQDCFLDRVNLKQVRLFKVEFSDSKLVGVDFSNIDTTLLSLLFSNCRIYACSFSHLKLKNGLQFTQCQIHETSFVEAKIPNSNFSDCDLRESMFHQADLSKSNFSGAFNFRIDPMQNRINQCKFSSTEVYSLLDGFDLEIV